MTSINKGVCKTGFHDNCQAVMLADQEQLRGLCFWSHPAAWSATTTLYGVAAVHWMMYHRIQAAMKKITLAQLIGSVAQVIPKSKLTKYGDFSYDFDYEDMYREVVDFNVDCVSDNSRKAGYSETSSGTESNVFGKRYKSVHDSEEQTKIKLTKKWLNKVKEVLRGAMHFANENCLCDSASEATLKLCLRIIHVANINDALVACLNDSQEVVHVNYDEEVLKMPTSNIELLSLPQPSNECDWRLGHEKIDGLWLKISKVRNLWDAKDKTRTINIEKQVYSDPLLPLIKTNFLRNHRTDAQGDVENDVQSVDIPREVQIQLLGSLLDVIEKGPLQIGLSSDYIDETERSWFPEAHGTWTKELFPNCTQFRDATAQRMTANHEVKPQQIYNSSMTRKEFNQCEGTQMPIQFYMSVPPPSRVNMKYPHLPLGPAYAYRQPQGRTLPPVLPPPPIVNETNFQVPQQVQCTLQTAPRAYTPSTMYVPTSTKPQNWNFQHLNTPAKVATIEPYQRLNFPGIVNPDYNPNNIMTFQNHVMRSDTTSFQEGKNFLPSEALLNNRRNRYKSGILETSMGSKPFTQLTNHGHILPNKGVTVGNNGITNQPVFYKNSTQIVANPYNKRIPLNANHQMCNYRLPSKVLQQQTFVPKSNELEQLACKQRYLGAYVVSNVKKLQERFYQQNFQIHNEIGWQLNQDARYGAPVDKLPELGQDRTLNAEDKVEKWLEAVHVHMKSNSCYDHFEDLSETFESNKENGLVLLKEVPTVNFTPVRKPRNNSLKLLFYFYKVGRNSYDTGRSGMTKLSKKKMEKVLSKHLQILEKPSIKLKKGCSLESKMKLLRNYFAEIEQKNANKCNSKPKTGNRRAIQSCENKHLNFRNKPKPGVKQQTYSKETKVYRDEGTADKKGIDKLNTSFFWDDKNNYKIFIRENRYFNTFPSKRTKICSTPQFFNDDEICCENDPDSAFANLNYIDRQIDDLFFSKNEAEGKTGEDKKSMNIGMGSGWNHFKLTIKLALKNAMLSLQRVNLKDIVNEKNSSK